jgi:SOS-response transcriptional repressor LexA
MKDIIDFHKFKQQAQSNQLYKNLMHLMKENKITITHLHKKTGIPITTIQRICKNPNANPTLASLIPLANYFSITIAQLIGEESLPNNSANTQSPSTSQLINVPILTWQQATQWPHTSIEQNPSITTEANMGSNSYALKVAEENIEGFHSNSILVVDPSLKPQNRDYVVSLKQGNDAATLKQILMHEDDTYLKPMNSDFKTTIMDESYRILGIVVQVRMNLK